MNSFYVTFVANNIQKINKNISILKKREDFTDIEKARVYEIY